MLNRVDWGELAKKYRIVIDTDAKDFKRDVILLLATICEEPWHLRRGQRKP